MRGGQPAVGTRVEAVFFEYDKVANIDDNLTVPPGTRGTVTGLYPGFGGCDRSQIWVSWDNGSTISLLPCDEYRVVTDA